MIFFSFLEKEVWVEYAREVSGTAYRIIPEEEPEGIAIFQARLGSRLAIPFDPAKLQSEIGSIENVDLRNLLAGLPQKNLSSGVFLPPVYVHSLLEYKKSEAFRKYSARIKDPNEGYKKSESSTGFNEKPAPGRQAADKSESKKEPLEGGAVKSPSGESAENTFEAKAKRAKEARETMGPSEKLEPAANTSSHDQDDNSFEAKAKRARELKEVTDKLGKLAKKFRI